ncbi:MAG: PKD domain-containing protein [Sphingobacteriales bacterium]|nr:PKD domain-containing protein [Sphingobacteriales bacterium]
MDRDTSIAPPLTNANTLNPSFTATDNSYENFNIEYTLTVSQNGCTNSDVVQVHLGYHPDITIEVPNGIDKICQGESVVLTASASGKDLEYIWSTGQTGTSITVSPTTTTTYTVTVQDQYIQCHSTKSVTIQVVEPPYAGESTTEAVCEFEFPINLPILLQGEDEGGIWTDAGGNEVNGSSIKEVGIYTYTVENMCGISTSTVTLTAATDCTDQFCLPVAGSEIYAATSYSIAPLAAAGTVNTPTIVSWNTVNNTLFTDGNPDNNIINTSIIIPLGYKLEIAAATLRFGPFGRIVVKSGAQLLIDNATLQSAGDCMWQGIRVLGPGINNNPKLNPQGKLVTQNNATIRDALIGVALMNTPVYDLVQLESTLPTPDLNNIASVNVFQNLNNNNNLAKTTSGGLAIINRTNFINCHQGINASHGYYNAINSGDLSDAKIYTRLDVYDSSFERSGDLLFPLDNGIHALGIWSFLYGNVYVGNTRFTKQYSGFFGRGVRSLNARSNIFQECYWGIRDGGDPGNLEAFTFGDDIVSNRFTNCRFGIHLTAERGLVRNRNILDRSNTIGTFYSMPNTGISLIGSEVDILEQNVVNRHKTDVFVRNGEQMGNLLCRNHFLNSLTGVLIQGNNLGLDIRCNEHAGYYKGWQLDNNFSTVLQMQDQGRVFKYSRCS